MSIDQTLVDLLTTSITRKAFLRNSTDGYAGSPGYSTASVAYSARVVQQRERVMDAQGQETVTSHMAWLASTVSWSVEDQLTHAGSTYRIVKLDRPTDETNVVHHTKLWLRA